MADLIAARKIYELMVLTAWADGHMHAAEASAIREIGAAVPDLDGIPDRVELSRAIKERIDQEGFDAPLRATAAALTARADRELAFRCCAKVLEADGDVEGEEAEVLATLQELFGLTADDVKRLLARLG